MILEYSRDRDWIGMLSVENAEANPKFQAFVGKMASTKTYLASKKNTVFPLNRKIPPDSRAGKDDGKNAT